MAVPPVRLAVVGIHCACLLALGKCEATRQSGFLQEAGHFEWSSRQDGSARQGARRLQDAPAPAVPAASRVAAILQGFLRPATPPQHTSPASAESGHGVQSMRSPMETLPSISTPLIQLFGSIADPPAPAPAPAPVPALASALLSAVGEQLNRTIGSALAGAGRSVAIIVAPFRGARPTFGTSMQATLANATRQDARSMGTGAQLGTGQSAQLPGRNATGPQLPNLAGLLHVGSGATLHADPASSSLPHTGGPLPVPSSKRGLVTSAGSSVAAAPSLTDTLGRIASDVATTAAEPFQTVLAAHNVVPVHRAEPATGPVRALAEQSALFPPKVPNPIGLVGALPGGVGAGPGAVLAVSSLITAAGAQTAAGAAGAAVRGIGTAASGLSSAAESTAGAVASLPGAAARLQGGAAAAAAALGDVVTGAAGNVVNRTGEEARSAAGAIVHAAGTAERVVASLPNATARLAGAADATVAPLGDEAVPASGAAKQNMGPAAGEAAGALTAAAEGAGRAVVPIPGTATRLADGAAAEVAPPGSRTAMVVEGALRQSSPTRNRASPEPLPPASAVPGPGGGLPLISAGASTVPSPTPPSPEPPASAGSGPSVHAVGGMSSAGGAAGLSGTAGPAGGLLTGLAASVLAASFLPGLATSGITAGVTLQNDVLVLISAAQNSGMQALLSQLFSDIQSVAIGLNFTNFGGSTVASSVSNIMQLYQEVPGLLSSRDSSGVGQVAQAVLQSMSSMCGGQGTELPSTEPPSCSGPSFTLSLVPWSCLLDSSQNALSCTPAYLLLTKAADTCTILNLSGGTLAGMACGIQKSFGFPSSSVLGGQQFYLRVSDIVSGLEAAASSPAASPAAGPVPSPAPSDNSFSASWGKVTNAFDQLLQR